MARRWWRGGILLGLLVCFSLPASSRDLSARAILDRHVEAIGGVERVLEKKAIHYQGRFAIPSLGVEGPFDLYRAGGRMHFEMTIPGFGSLLQGYDGAVGWELQPGAPSLLEGGRLEQLALQAHPRSELRSIDDYPEIESMGEVEFEGETLLEVRLVSRGGHEHSELYDPNTGLRRASITRRAGADGDQEVVLLFGEYRDFGGLLIATELVQRGAGQVLERTVEKVEYQAIADEQFELPPEIVALRAGN